MHIPNDPITIKALNTLFYYVTIQFEKQKQGMEKEGFMCPIAKMISIGFMFK